jgi:hypothetical protein
MKRPMIVSRDAFIAQKRAHKKRNLRLSESAAAEELASGEIGLM